MRVTKLAKARALLEGELLRTPTHEELATFLGEDSALKEDIQYLHTIIRLDIPRTDGGDATLHEVLFEEESFDDKIKDFSFEFLYLAQGLPERTLKIICMYYGIGLPRTYNLREIGEDLSLTRERVRQIKEEALKKIKGHPEGSILFDYL